MQRFLHEMLPEIKLALGEVIDRENASPLPGRYARLLPDTLLVVTLRPDLAATVTPVSGELERDLSDACTRHGSLYDRSYRVELRRSERQSGSWYRISAHAGHPSTTGASSNRPVVERDTDEAKDARPLIPASDPDETQMPGAGSAGGWKPGRFLLVVEGEDGEQRSVFRLIETLTTVGRQSDDPALHTVISLANVPHVSRRQLALVWNPRSGNPGFRLFNLGLNPMRVNENEVPGERVRWGPLHLEQVPSRCTAWVAPGSSIRLSSEGPVLRLEEVKEPGAADDPDATVRA